MIEMYNISNGLEGIESGSVFIKRVRFSRAHAQKLLKQKVRLNVVKYFLSNRVCDEWNRLPG